ncbi:MAG: nuclear transport factor 2 family protein [Myxococcota bacterium]
MARAALFAAKGFGELRGRERILDFPAAPETPTTSRAPSSLEKDVQAVEGDRAVVIAQLHARTARGRPYSNRYAFGFRFREGRICEAWELLDSVHFQKQQAAE